MKMQSPHKRMGVAARATVEPTPVTIGAGQYEADLDYMTTYAVPEFWQLVAGCGRPGSVHLATKDEPVTRYAYLLLVENRLRHGKLGPGAVRCMADVSSVCCSWSRIERGAETRRNRWKGYWSSETMPGHAEESEEHYRSQAVELRLTRSVDDDVPVPSPGDCVPGPGRAVHLKQGLGVKLAGGV
jgi:hypothetical protein